MSEHPSLYQYIQGSVLSHERPASGHQDLNQFTVTSVSVRWRVPYAVEENLRGMTERKNERQRLGLFTIRFCVHLIKDLQLISGPSL